MDNERKKGIGNNAMNVGDDGEFWFKLRVELSPLQRLKSEESDLNVSLNFEGKQVRIKAVPKGPMNKARTIDFDVHGFATHGQAHEVGLRFRRAVLLAAAKNMIGVDAGIDQKIRDQTQPEENQWAKRQGYGLRNAMMGLTVYKSGESKGAMLSDVHIVHLPEIQPFLDGIVTAFGEDKSLSEKQQLALELYGLSHFETSERARFLILTSVIEVLSKQERCPKETQEVLKKILQRLKSSRLPKNQKDPLIEGFNRLKRQSISKACQELVLNALGQDQANRFKRIYILRSRLLHEGFEKKGNFEFGTLELRNMIAAIFRKTIT